MARGIEEGDEAVVDLDLICTDGPVSYTHLAKAEAKPAAKQNNKKNEQHKKREEKTVSLSELARETGAKASAAPAQSVSVRREDSQVTVDTRTVDVNVDRFDARYDDLASVSYTHLFFNDGSVCFLLSDGQN